VVRGRLLSNGVVRGLTRITPLLCSPRTTRWTERNALRFARITLALYPSGIVRGKIAKARIIPQWCLSRDSLALVRHFPLTVPWAVNSVPFFLEGFTMVSTETELRGVYVRAIADSLDCGVTAVILLCLTTEQLATLAEIVCHA